MAGSPASSLPQDGSEAKVIDSRGTNLSAEQIHPEPGVQSSDLLERYDRLVELAPDAILVHVSGIIGLANAAAVHLAGAQHADQLIGRLITDFLVPPYLKSVELHVLEGRAMAREGAVADRFRRLDGTLVDVEVTAIPFVDLRHQPSAHLVIRDMSERAEARDSEQLASSQLQLLLNQLPALIWTADLSLRVTSMQGNRDILLAVGLATEPNLVALQERALRGESTTSQFEAHDRWLEARVEPLHDADHALVGCLGLIHDVTTRKLMDSKQSQLSRDAAIGTLAGGVAHEVNNMMAVVLGFSDLLLESPLVPEEQRIDLREIRRAAERATAITSQLLAFSRRGSFLPVVVRLDALLAGAMPLLQNLLGESRQVRKAFDCPRSVRIDVGQFELVLVNLAINARDAMPTGGTLTITAGLEDVQGAIARNGQVVPPGPHGVVRIGDTGAGMEPAVLAHIFEPFFTTKPRGKGTGLGLAAVAGILDRHGIAFRVDTVVGQGTTFTLYVPLVEDAPVVEAQGLGPPKPKEIPHTLLVIDDEEALRNMISRSLEQHGYRVLQADGGVAALAVLEREGPPDAVLLDLTMPGMAGAEVAQRIAARWPGLPVLFMSGHTDDDVARLLAELPGSDLLGKPFDTPSLMAKVEELLRKRRETGAAQDRPEPRTPPDAQET